MTTHIDKLPEALETHDERIEKMQGFYHQVLTLGAEIDRKKGLSLEQETALRDLCRQASAVRGRINPQNLTPGQAMFLEESVDAAFDAVANEGGSLASEIVAGFYYPQASFDPEGSQIGVSVETLDM